PNHPVLPTGACLRRMTRLAQPLQIAPVQEQPAIAMVWAYVVPLRILLSEGTGTARPCTEGLFTEDARPQSPHRMPPQRQVVQVLTAITGMDSTAASRYERAAAGLVTEHR